MAERIYTKDRRGELAPLYEKPFSNEDELQALVASYPELLDGEQMRPDDPRRWIIITREKGISERPDENARWSLDHLIIDQNAVPTLVEVKRGSNPEIRRAIVGQMLEYAAHAAHTWTADELRQTFESASKEPGLDPNTRLTELLQTDEEPDVDAFWENVATNLAARRLRLLFVSDEIPDSLARVVEFLNEQMLNIEVLAVEIKQFPGESLQTLVPRVIGRTAAASGRTSGGTKSRRKLNRETFFEELPNEKARRVAEKLLDAAHASGASLSWRANSVTIRILCSIFQYPVTVAWLHTKPEERMMPFYFRDITFGAAIFEGYGELPRKLRDCLDKWVNEFTQDAFIEDISGDGTKAWAVRYDDAAPHIELLTERLEKIISELRAL